MEKINDFIHVVMSEGDSEVARSVCYTELRQAECSLLFEVFHKDCFFDLNGRNYKIDIRIDLDYFEKYGEPLEIYYPEQPICCRTQSILYDMVNCSFQGLTRKIYMEGLILQLIHHTQPNPMVTQWNCDSCFVVSQPLEREKIEQTRNYILNHLDENLTIPQLASYVGTNQCYLKKGFKEIVGTTIFDFIQENRMHTAKQLLQAGHCSVSDVSMKVGYRSMSSFSQAFKNYYGSNPSVFIKKIIESN